VAAPKAISKAKLIVVRINYIEVRLIIDVHAFSLENYKTPEFTRHEACEDLPIIVIIILQVINR